MSGRRSTRGPTQGGHQPEAAVQQVGRDGLRVGPLVATNELTHRARPAQARERATFAVAVAPTASSRSRGSGSWRNRSRSTPWSTVRCVRSSRNARSAASRTVCPGNSWQQFCQNSELCISMTCQVAIRARKMSRSTAGTRCGLRRAVRMSRSVSDARQRCKSRRSIARVSSASLAADGHPSIGGSPAALDHAMARSEASKIKSPCCIFSQCSGEIG